MDTKDLSATQLAAFVILMESGEGIIDKSPDYIMEKWRFCSGEPNLSYLMGIMDQVNQAKFSEWIITWKQ